MKACALTILASANVEAEAEMMRRQLEPLFNCDIALVLAADVEPTRIRLSGTDLVFMVVAGAPETWRPGSAPRMEILRKPANQPGLPGLAGDDNHDSIEILCRHLAQRRDCDIAYVRVTDVGLTHVELTRLDVNTVFLVLRTSAAAGARPRGALLDAEARSCARDVPLSGQPRSLPGRWVVGAHNDVTGANALRNRGVSYQST